MFYKYLIIGITSLFISLQVFANDYWSFDYSYDFFDYPNPPMYNGFNHSMPWQSPGYNNWSYDGDLWIESPNGNLVLNPFEFYENYYN